MARIKRTVGKYWLTPDREALAGYVSLGILGTVKVRIERNKLKSRSRQADYLMFVFAEVPDSESHEEEDDGKVGNKAHEPSGSQEPDAG